MKHDLLLEIGTEEMPANYLSYADNPENDLFRKKFDEVFALFNESGAYTKGELAVYLTPRRIVLFSEGIGFDPSPRKEAVYGPAAAAAFDPQGKPTPALAGFMKSKGITEKDLAEFDNKGKKCVGFWKSEKPKPLAAILGEFVAAYLKALSFPKTMKWDDSDLRFPRPIRNILCLLDDKPIKFKIGKLTSGNQTLFFQAAARRALRVKTAAAYFAALKKAGIILDAADRKKLIEKNVEALTTKHGGTYVKDDGLLEEVAYLTETPVAISGPFDTEYSNLPREVLISSLSKKQRLFSVMNASGKHLPFFAAVLDGDVKSRAAVAKTVSAVLKAKLQDSHFFYEEDVKIYKSSAGLDKLTAELANLAYLKDMGKMSEKVARITALAESLAPSWGLESKELADLKDAARFCKTDLLTQMVGEFPELQGIMGGYYVQTAGRSQNVATAIADHYLPSSPEGKLPGTRAAAALSILDKADLVIACFASGKTPSSSQDPYALKRNMAGIFRTSIHHKIPLNWESLASNLLKQIETQGFLKQAKAQPQQILKDLNSFYAERLSYFFEHQRKYEPELIQAVLETRPASVLAADERLSALARLHKSASFGKALKIIQRTSNILKGAQAGEIGQTREDLFKEDSEKQLFERYKSQKTPIEAAAGSRDYALATSLYADAFFDILHTFFEKVLVNSPDPEVRRNRLSLLDAVKTLYTRQVADLSKIKASDNDL